MLRFTRYTTSVMTTALVLGGLLSGCTADGPTEPAAGGLPSGRALFANTHEPSGMTAVISQPFSSASLAGWLTMPTSVKFNADLQALLSPGSFGRLTYPAGFAGGRAPGTTESSSFGGRMYKEVYVRMGVRISPNFYGHASNTNKVLHFWGYNPQANRVFLSFEGKGLNPLLLQVRCQGSPDDSKCGHLRGNTGASSVISRGTWHVVEVRVRVNTPGASNGIVEAWIDGVRTHYYTDIRLNVGGWAIVSWSPTWGGVGGTVPAMMTMDMDHIYVSGRL